MSRFNSSGAAQFDYHYLGEDYYAISWTVDYYYPDSRLRFPRRISRITDEAGVRRFCGKHNLTFIGTEPV